MKTKPVLSIAALTLVTFLFVAFVAPPPVTKFKADVKSSSLLWTGKKVTGQHNGTISLSSGELIAEGKTIKGGSFEIDVTSLAVTDLTDKSYNDKLVTHLKSDDFFGATKYPKATFTIASVSPNSGDQYLIKGDLTIKGKTNPIEFSATIVLTDKQVTAKAKIIVNRAKYDIRYGSKSFFDNLGDKVIYDDFELDLNLVATL